MAQTLLSDEDLQHLNARFARVHPREIVRWALEEPALPWVTSVADGPPAAYLLTADGVVRIVLE